MTKCKRCRRRYTQVTHEYLGYITCDFCEERISRNLREHREAWIEKEIHDRPYPNCPGINIVIRDKLEMFVVHAVLRHYYGKNTTLVDSMRIGEWTHSGLSSQQNQVWQQVLVEYRRCNLLGIPFTQDLTPREIPVTQQEDDEDEYDEGDDYAE